MSPLCLFLKCAHIEWTDHQCGCPISCRVQDVAENCGVGITWQLNKLPELGTWFLFLFCSVFYISYDIMLNCWQYDASDRPTFNNIRTTLEEFVETPEILFGPLNDIERVCCRLLFLTSRPFLLNTFHNYNNITKNLRYLSDCKTTLGCKYTHIKKWQQITFLNFFFIEKRSVIRNISWYTKL